MDNLPRDVQLKIIRKMDIDTRRSLGIYNKLRIANTHIRALQKWIPHPSLKVFEDQITISLGKTKEIYKLEKQFGQSEDHESVGSSEYFLGRKWYHESICNPDYMKICKKYELQLYYVEIVANYGMHRFFIVS